MASVVGGAGKYEDRREAAACLEPAAERIARWLPSRAPRAGNTRVLAIEGRSGAGKSTLAGLVAARLGGESGPPVLRMDDLYDGWDGLAAGIDRLVAQILEPLAGGGRPRWRRYDWAARRYAEWHELAAPAVLIVEGVGAGALPASRFLSGLIWVAAPEEERRRRALARDGDTFAPHWDRWARQEERYLAVSDVVGRADMLVNGALRTGRPG